MGTCRNRRRTEEDMSVRAGVRDIHYITMQVASMQMQIQAAAIAMTSPVVATIFRTLLVVFCFCAPGSAIGQQQPLVYIGATVYLPGTNLGSAITPLRGIFEGNISRFLVEENYTTVLNTMKFHSSSDSMVRELSTTFGLSGSPTKAVELSLETSLKSLKGSQTNVTSSLAVVESYSKRVFLRNERERAVETIPLRTDFLQELRNLPILPSPTSDDGWGPYRSFLTKWGSHYISTIYSGSWLRQWSVAASSQRYSQRQIEAKACAKLTGVATIPSIQGCAGFSTNEMMSSLNLQTNDEIEVRGGQAATAAAIVTGRTDALVRQFIEEGRTSNVPVRYGFLPIWRPVLDTYTSPSSKEWQVATALEAYFNGFLAFECPRKFLSSRSVILQQFRRKQNGFYECVRTCVGCKSNYDCTLNSAACYCYGESCVIAQPPDGRPQIQRYKDNLSTWDLPNLSCYYSFPYCVCDTKSQEPNCGQDGFIPIWSQDKDSSALSSTTSMDSDVI